MTQGILKDITILVAVVIIEQADGREVKDE